MFLLLIYEVRIVSTCGHCQSFQNKEQYFFPSLSPFLPESLVSRDRFGSPVPRQPAHLHTQAESGAYFLQDTSRIPRRHPFIYLNRRTPSGRSRVYRVSPEFIGSPRNCVPIWRSVHHQRSTGTGSPLVLGQDDSSSSNERILPFQVTPWTIFLRTSFSTSSPLLIGLLLVQHTVDWTSCATQRVAVPGIYLPSRTIGENSTDIILYYRVYVS